MKRYTDPFAALETLQAQIAKASQDDRDGDADTLGQVEAFLVNLISAPTGGGDRD